MKRYDFAAGKKEDTKKIEKAIVKGKVDSLKTRMPKFPGKTSLSVGGVHIGTVESVERD